MWNVTTWMRGETVVFKGFPGGKWQSIDDGGARRNAHGDGIRNDGVAFGHHIRYKVEDMQGWGWVKSCYHSQYSTCWPKYYTTTEKWLQRMLVRHGSDKGCGRYAQSPLYNNKLIKQCFSVEGKLYTLGHAWTTSKLSIN